jgi:hypothetical protein
LKRGIGGILAALALLPPSLLVGPAEAADPLLGTYVGRAHEVDLQNGEQVDRDIDIVIESGDEGGFKISWTNVTLVGGRRDVPGVKRRSDQVVLKPAPDAGFYLASVGYDPFRTKRETDPTRGDPLRWGVRDGDAIRVYSFAILEDGTYELQAYVRRRTAQGLDLAFERVVDGAVVRRMSGHAVRVD